MCTANVQLCQYSFVNELCMINCSIHLLCHCDKTCMLLHERQQHACVCSFSMQPVPACVCSRCMHVFACCMVQLSGFGNTIQKILGTKRQIQKNLDLRFLTKTCSCEVFSSGQIFFLTI